MTDELDIRIRALVANAVADAPAAPPTPRPSATVQPFARPAARRAGWAWAGAAVAAAAAAVTGVVVLGGDDSPGRVVPATGVTEPTLIRTTDPSPLVGWREDLVVLIAADGVIQRVWAEDGALAQAELAQALQGDVAFELPDGTVVSDEGLMDVGPDGQALYSGTWTGFTAVYQYPLGGSRPADPLMIPFDGEPTRLTAATDLVVGEGSLFAGGRTPIHFVPSTGMNDGTVFVTAGVVAPLADDGEAPRLFSVSPSGRMIGWIEGDEFVLSDGFRYTIPEGSNVVEVDLGDTYVAFTRADGPGTIIDLRDGTAFTAPAAGRITISMAPAEGGQPQPVESTVPGTSQPTTTTPTQSTVQPILGADWKTVSFGEAGVVSSSASGGAVWTTEPMMAAVMAPDGSLIVQRKTGYSGAVEHAMEDTVPLRIAAPGAEPQDLFAELLPAADLVAAWYTVHDAATVNGRPLLLVERQYVAEGIDTEAGDLLTLDLETGAMTTVVDAFAGWEQGSSRLHLTETGLVVGDFFDLVTHSFFALSINGGAVPTAADLGIEPSYSDCSDCPRRFTVSRDGTTLAWLDGTELVVADATGGQQQRYELGDAAVDAADLAIGDGYVVLSYAYSWQEAGDPPLVVLYASDEQVTLPGRSATLAA